MPDEQIDSLFRQPVCWLMDNGPEDDIAISSRIRLARNLSGEPFPIRSDDATLGFRVQRSRKGGFDERLQYQRVQGG